MTRELPPGWIMTPLSKVVSLVRKSVQPDEIRPGDLYIGLEHVSSGTGEYTGVPALEADIKSAKFRFEPGDLLYGKLRPNLRKCTVVETTGICSTDLIPLRANDPEAAPLLCVQLRSPAFTESVMRLIGGANLPRVNVKDLLAIQIPVPPLGDRERLQQEARSLLYVRKSMRMLQRRVDDLESAITADSLGRIDLRDAHSDSISTNPLERISLTQGALPRPSTDQDQIRPCGIRLWLESLNPTPVPVYKVHIVVCDWIRLADAL
jgi:type I restriction enzyme S subunit